MKKLVLALTIICASVLTSNAQWTPGDFKFGIGLRAALPIGDMHNVSSFGLGGEVQGEYAFAENLTGVVTSGYTRFFGKSFDDGLGDTYKTNYGHIPVLVGARFYPSEQFFVGAQIGYGHYSGSTSYSGNGVSGSGGSGSTGGFEYRPQIGYNADPVQLIFSYDGTAVSGGTFSHLGLSILYTFGGGSK
ncbi:outer membrane beta-barrel protein [Puia sp.]|uniref:outer membrane beta-barrel protein n=1 Tax=Puia sp. TaxID=2045100 RepID=UPI002F41D14A